MKLKGLAEAKQASKALLEDIEERLDELDQEDPRWEARDSFLNDAWMLLDEIGDKFTELQELKQEDYFD